MKHVHLLYSAAILFAAVPGLAQPTGVQVNVSERVNLGAFDPVSKTFQGTTVNLNASPCLNTSFTQSLNAGDVKSEAEAREKVKQLVDQITDALQRQYDQCHKK
jgi:hypothetical protein